MATSLPPVSRNPAPSTTSWGIVLLEHLDEFATLAWYLVADGRLVEDTFSRTLAKLDTIPFEASIPEITYNQARDVLIAQAIAVVSDMRTEEAGDWSAEPNSMGRLPDLARLAFMLKLIIRSPEPETAKYLGVSPHEVQALVDYAIDRLSVASPVAAMRAPHQVWVSYAFESQHESSRVASTDFISRQPEATPGIHLITRLEGDDVMARVIEFHIPSGFKPRVKWVPQEELGRLVAFPNNRTTRCEIGQFSIEKGPSD
jgi:DNA-directed RNA polymerase specialized sigma24 family protein